MNGWTALYDAAHRTLIAPGGRAGGRAVLKERAKGRGNGAMYVYVLESGDYVGEV